MTIDLLQIETEALPFACDVALSPDAVDPDLVAGPLEVRLEGRVTPVGGEFSVTGRCAVTAQVYCSRCLEPVSWSSSEEFALRYRAAALPSADDDVELAADDLDLVAVPDGQLDLAQLAVEQVMLALPMRAVCRPDCAGLCPRCAANRNRPGACQCEPETDPRWEPLAGIRVDDN